LFYFYDLTCFFCLWLIAFSENIWLTLMCRQLDKWMCAVSCAGVQSKDVKNLNIKLLLEAFFCNIVRSLARLTRNIIIWCWWDAWKTLIWYFDVMLDMNMIHGSIFLPEMMCFFLGFWICIYLEKFVGLKCIWAKAEMYLSWVDMYGLWLKYIWTEIVVQF
jgi:hypothetical protein